ncbi:MAG: TIM barrel protein, partial [Planctomycetota bacterium]
LRGVVPTLRDCNVKIALEPLGPAEGNFLNTAAQARRLQAMVGDPTIGLHLDVKAMASEPDGILTVIRDNADWTLHFHANDPNLLGPGMGDVEFPPISRCLRDANYDGWVSVEVFDYRVGVETIVKTSMMNMLAAENS